MPTLIWISSILRSLLPLALGLWVLGCTGEGGDGSPQNAESGKSRSAENSAPPPHLTPRAAPEVIARLAALDADDGQTDQVVSKCIPCALMMGGSSQHAVTVEDYVVELCGAKCKDRFAQAPSKYILEVGLP